MKQYGHKTEGVYLAQKVRFHPTPFTGKERDEETGYGYFGARYMDHELMTMWLSVDPMADKYPSISPYAYCAWNPVKLVDPDGRDMDDYKFNEKTGELTLVRRTDDDFDIIDFTESMDFLPVKKGILNGENEGDDISKTGFDVTDSELMSDAVAIVKKLSRSSHKEIAIAGYGEEPQSITKLSVLPWNKSTCDHVSAKAYKKGLIFIAHTHFGCADSPGTGTGTPSDSDKKLLTTFPGVDMYIISEKQGLTIFGGKSLPENYSQGTSYLAPLAKSTPHCLKQFIKK